MYIGCVQGEASVWAKSDFPLLAVSKCLLSPASTQGSATRPANLSQWEQWRVLLPPIQRLPARSTQGGRLPLQLRGQEGWEGCTARHA